MEWFHWDDLAKLTLAALTGAAIGFERESHGQAAGLRTNILVCTGACLMMLLSLYMEERFRTLGVTESVVRLDPGRIASYAIASMGFLGAGAIIKAKGTIKGLTTAAGLWLVTGVGLAVGAGFIMPAIFTTFISLIFLYGLRRLKVILPRTEFVVLTIWCSGACNPIEQIKEVISGYRHLTVHFINYSNEIKKMNIVYRIRLSHRAPVCLEDITDKLALIDCIDGIRWEESDIP
jgi:putative Mg2+ transporter-C (MgtC) family protein